MIINWIKKKLVIIIVTAILLGGITFLFNRWQNALQDSRDKDTIIFNWTKQYKDASGALVTVTSEQKFTKQQLQDLKAKGDKDVTKLIEENTMLGLKLKNTATSLIFYTQMQDSFSVKTKKWRDTISHLKDSLRPDETIYYEQENYCDNWFTLSRYKMSNEDSSHYSISYKDSLYIFINVYKDAKWFLPKLWKPWQYKCDAKFLNPNSQILKSFFITINRKRR